MSVAGLLARRPASLLALAFVAALAVRLLPVPAATSGGVRLLSPDCYGHLRRAASVARNFPRVRVTDPWLNHPDGGVWIWPPAFDLLVGGAARAAYGREATLDEVALVAASLPPLLGALHVFPLYFFARRAFGRVRASLAVLAYAFLPAAAVWSQFGHADQHVAEALALLLFLAAAARASACPGRGRVVAALLAGAALALLLLTWQGAVLSAALGLLWSALFLGTAAAPLALAAVSLTALGAAAALRGETVPFAFVSFGWFQPSFVAALSLLALLPAAARTRSRALKAALGLSAIAIVLLVAPRASDLLQAVRRGGAYLLVRAPSAVPPGAGEFGEGGYLSYPADFLKVVFEARPLLAGPKGPALARALSELSPALLWLPAALALWSVAALGRGGLQAAPRRAARVLVVLFGAVTLVLTLLQRRNVYYLAIFVALAAADLAVRLASGSARIRRRAFALPAALLLAFVLLPGLPVYARLAAYADAPGRDVLDVLRRLAALDPPPVDPAGSPPPAPGSIPGVMAPWAMGHFVTALTGRPAAADPFAYGWRRQARLFSATDDLEALGILRAARCRYLVTTDLRPVIAAYAVAAGRAPAPPEARFGVRVHESVAEHPVPFLTRVLDSRTAARGPDGRLVPRFRVFRVDEGP